MGYLIEGGTRFNAKVPDDEHSQGLKSYKAALDKEIRKSKISYSRLDKSSFEIRRCKKQLRHLRAIKQEIVTKILAEKNIDIASWNSVHLEVVQPLLTTFVEVKRLYKTLDWDYSGDMPSKLLIVGYEIKNNGDKPCKYIKHTYDQNGQEHVGLSDILPGTQVIIQRHELESLRLFNGAMLQNGKIVMRSISDGYQYPYICGYSGKGWLTNGCGSLVDDGVGIKEKYKEQFIWVANPDQFRTLKHKR